MKANLAGIFLGLALGLTQVSAQTLLHLQTVTDGDSLNSQTVDGLNFIYATAVSPDGNQVYCVGGIGGSIGSDNAITVFNRGTDGRLSFLEVLFDDDDSNNPGTADGLFACRDLVISPDGSHIYTAGSLDNKIGIFNRNAGTGQLTFLGIVEEGGSIQGLNGVESLAMTTDGATLFAVGRSDDSLIAFSRNPSTGHLTIEDSAVEGLGVTGLDRPLCVAVSPDGKHVYTAAGGNSNFTGSDAVAAFTWDAANKQLGFTASYFEGQAQGGNIIDGLNRVNCVTVSPDGRHVYASGGLDIIEPADKDWIAIFSRNPETGELTWLESIEQFQFCQFDILFEFETYVRISQDNRRVFVTNATNAIVGFLRDPETGKLTFVDGDCFYDSLTEDFSTGINLPKKFSLDSAGKHLYIPGTASDAVGVFGPDFPAIKIQEVSEDQVVLRLTHLSAGLPSRIESGTDLQNWPEIHSFVPETLTYQWSKPVGGATKLFFRAGIE